MSAEKVRVLRPVGSDGRPTVRVQRSVPLSISNRTLLVTKTRFDSGKVTRAETEYFPGLGKSAIALMSSVCRAISFGATRRG